MAISSTKFQILLLLLLFLWRGCCFILLLLLICLLFQVPMMYQALPIVLSSVNRVMEKKDSPPQACGVYLSELRGQDEYKLQGPIRKSPPVWMHISLRSILFTLDTEVQSNHGQRIGKQVQRPNSITD